MVVKDKLTNSFFYILIVVEAPLNEMFGDFEDIKKAFY
jgi:hypothetical protein